MKKASRIMYLVNMIICFIIMGMFIFLGIAQIVVGCIPAIQDAIKEGMQGVEEQYRETVYFITIGSIIGSGIACLFAAAFAGASAFLSLKARNNGNKTLYILNIIFGALGGGEIAIAASILALIAESKEKKGEKEVKEIEEK